ncbi:DUF4296 domain-containing protein [Dyadobacter tibetensis]|uniref:DUF4296 domain-containing protein n=1 Tax=Dyadobacter tibetensis TaxID=1211851 RepID=UPI00103B594E|nr:DUF4296 domain-containing protein [Dyadobacter tibetensis]
MANWTKTKITILRVLRLTHSNFTLLLVLMMALVLCMGGCIREDKVPEGTIAQEKMASILTDIHIAEARVSKLQLNSVDSSILVFDRLKADIWKKHQVDTLQYKTSYEFYVTHPGLMKEIYDQVNKLLEKREKEKNIKI